MDTGSVLGEYVKPELTGFFERKIADRIVSPTYTREAGCMSGASVTAVLDALWTPSCRSTSERRGFSFHFALIRLYSIFFVFSSFLFSSLTCD